MSIKGIIYFKANACLAALAKINRSEDAKKSNSITKHLLILLASNNGCECAMIQSIRSVPI